MAPPGRQLEVCRPGRGAQRLCAPAPCPSTWLRTRSRLTCGLPSQTRLPNLGALVRPCVACARQPSAGPAEGRLRPNSMTLCPWFHTNGWSAETGGGGRLPRRERARSYRVAGQGMATAVGRIDRARVATRCVCTPSVMDTQHELLYTRAAPQGAKLAHGNAQGSNDSMRQRALGLYVGQASTCHYTMGSNANTRQCPLG